MSSQAALLFALLFLAGTTPLVEGKATTRFGRKKKKAKLTDGAISGIAIAVIAAIIIIILILWFIRRRRARNHDAIAS